MSLKNVEVGYLVRPVSGPSLQLRVVRYARSRASRLCHLRPSVELAPLHYQD